MEAFGPKFGKVQPEGLHKSLDHERRGVNSRRRPSIIQSFADFQSLSAAVFPSAAGPLWHARRDCLSLQSLQLEGPGRPCLGPLSLRRGALF